MKTKHLELFPNWIKAYSFWVSWHANDQTAWYEGLKEGRLHGESKWWDSDGQLRWHNVYENGRSVKEIV